MYSHSLNILSSRAGYLNFGLSLSIHRYFTCDSSEGSGERLSWAFAGRSVISILISCTGSLVFVQMANSVNQNQILQIIILKCSEFPTKCWLVLIRKANIQNFECLHRGLEVTFRNDRCFQISL